MSQIILETVKPVVVEKLRYLAQRHQRSLEAEIAAILESATENEPIVTPKNRGWSAGFFEDVIGGWEGKPLVREPQPEYQERDFSL